MEKIKKILLIFAIDTFIMLVSWAGLFLILALLRVLSPPEFVFIKVLPLYLFLTILACYAFFLIYDLCEYLFTENWIDK
jgi:hypothetical protein